MIFREELNDLKDRYLDRLQVVHIFSREDQATPLLNGRITADKLRELGKELIDIARYDEAFVCGPESMTTRGPRRLDRAGHRRPTTCISSCSARTSSGWSRPVADGPTTRSSSTSCSAGSAARSMGDRDDTVLDAASAAGLDVPFSCTGGVCATCRARVVDGWVEMAVNYALQPWELEAGFVLTCQSRPTSDAVTIDYDAV